MNIFNNIIRIRKNHQNLIVSCALQERYKILDNRRLVTMSHFLKYFYSPGWKKSMNQMTKAFSKHVYAPDPKTQWYLKMVTMSKNVLFHSVTLPFFNELRFIPESIHCTTALKQFHIFMHWKKMIPYSQPSIKSAGTSSVFSAVCRPAQKAARVQIAEIENMTWLLKRQKIPVACRSASRQQLFFFRG